MKIINKRNILKNKKEIIDKIRKGCIFVYPSDTIYGIGCTALNSESVKKIRETKKRDEKPFSVIAPNKEWIRKNCYVSPLAGKWLKKLPGKYTLILELRDLIKEADVPFVTTSVNLSGEKNIESINKINEEMRREIDYAVDERVLKGKASRVVSLINGDKVLR